MLTGRNGAARAQTARCGVARSWVRAVCASVDTLPMELAVGDRLSVCVSTWREVGALCGEERSRGLRPFRAMEKRFGDLFEVFAELRFDRRIAKSIASFIELAGGSSTVERRRP